MESVLTGDVGLINLGNTSMLDEPSPLLFGTTDQLTQTFDLLSKQDEFYPNFIG